MRQWKTSHGQLALHLGSLDNAVCWVVETKDNSTLYGWNLPGVVCPIAGFDSVAAAKARAEQLLDLWLHRAGVEES